MSIASATRRQKKRRTEQQRRTALYRATAGKDAKPPWIVPPSKEPVIQSLPFGTKINMVPGKNFGPPLLHEHKGGFLKKIWQRLTGHGRGK